MRRPIPLPDEPGYAIRRKFWRACRVVVYVCIVQSFASLSAYAQPGEQTLTGTLHLKKGGTYSYQLVFTVSGTAIQGYSVLQPHKGPSLQAKIKGTYNKNAQTLVFKESFFPLIAHRDACLLDAKLTYRLDGGKFKFTGTFTGTDNHNKRCNEGTIELEQPYKQRNSFEAEKSAATAVPRHETKSYTPSADTRQFKRLTTGQTLEFNWKTDTCYLEIWDGEVIDGDMVTIVYNEQTAVAYYMLTGTKKRLALPLTEPSNKITIIAENEGKAPPNTAQILLIDGKKHYGVLSSIIVGKSADIVIHRQ